MNNLKYIKNFDQIEKDLKKICNDIKEFILFRWALYSYLLTNNEKRLNKYSKLKEWWEKYK